MAPRNHSRPTHQRASESESDSDAPEAVSLSQSKKQIQQLDAKRKNAELAERQNKRTVNREKDKKLKERAERNKEVTAPEKAAGNGKGKGKADEADDLEARMERAMAEANEESGDDESDEEHEYEEFKGIKLSKGSAGSRSDDSEGGDQDDSDDVDEGDEDSKDDDDEEEEEEIPTPKSNKIKFNPDHLPDELFTAAFASKPKRKSEEESEIEAVNPPAKKRKLIKPKDIVVGSRAIRTLSSSDKPSIPATLPSKKIEKFLDRTLALKGGRQPGKGWERRPANIGVLRRDGPALNFVRSS